MSEFVYEFSACYAKASPTPDGPMPWVYAEGFDMMRRMVERSPDTIRFAHEADFDSYGGFSAWLTERDIPHHFEFVTRIGEIHVNHYPVEMVFVIHVYAETDALQIRFGLGRLPLPDDWRAMWARDGITWYLYRNMIDPL